MIAEGMWDNTMHLGKTTQYYFYDVNPKWQTVTLHGPGSFQGIDNFDALIKMATQSQVRPVLSLRPKTV